MNLAIVDSKTESPRTGWRLINLRELVYKKRNAYSPEVRERVVRLVLTSEPEDSSRRAATQSVAAKIGCTAETLRTWINKLEVDPGERSGVTTDQAKAFKDLQRENKELKRAHELLRKAAAFLAQAKLDRKPR